MGRDRKRWEGFVCLMTNWIRYNSLLTKEKEFFTKGGRWPSLLLLLLSRFSCVQLCATPWTAAHQAPPSMEFPRHEYWSGVPLPSLTKSATPSVLLPSFGGGNSQPCNLLPKQQQLLISRSVGPTLCDPIDCSPPCSSPGKDTGVGCHYLPHILFYRLWLIKLQGNESLYLYKIL